MSHALNRFARLCLAVIAVVVAACPGMPAQAVQPTTFAGMAFEAPDGWTVKTFSDGVLVSRSWQDSAGRSRGAALIQIDQPVATGPGQLAATLAKLFRRPPELAREKPWIKLDGVTVNGHQIHAEHRCCGHRNGVSMSADYVAILTDRQVLTLSLLVLNLSNDDEKLAAAGFDSLVRSLRPTAADRAFSLEPPAGAGGLDGVFSTLETGLQLNPFGGMDFRADNLIMAFSPSGLYTRTLPTGGDDIAAHCRNAPADCGVYRLTGGGLFGGARSIELGDVSAHYGLIQKSSKPFERDGADLKIGGQFYRHVPPLPHGTHFEGYWSSLFATSGSIGSQSTSVSSEHSLTLHADGTFVRTGSTSFSSSGETGDTRTGVAGTTARPAQQGTYAIEGYELTLTGSDGHVEHLSLYEPDPNSTGLLVINGSNFLKK